MVQNFIVHKVSAKLSKNLNAAVSVRHIDISFFDKMNIEGTLIKDKKNDTLLYAGSVNVNITDWFFWKDNIVLKYLALNDAVIHLNRKDSIWNYQFLVDYFSSPSKKTDTSKNVIKLDLNKVIFNTVAFVPHRQNVVVKKSDEINGDWNPENWKIIIKLLKINQGNLAIEQETNRPAYIKQFDDQHIFFTKINGSFSNTILNRDTITSKVNITALNPSGFIIRRLSSELKFSPVIMEFKKLDLVTNNSHLGDYYSMSYKDFNRDMNDFTAAVKLKGVFKRSVISSDDISYFAPELKSWKKQFILNGSAEGTIENLNAHNVSINSGITNFQGNFSIRGLPDINKSYFDVVSENLQTNIQDLTVFVPQLKQITQPNLRSLGEIRFKGFYKGTLDEFITNGLLTTSIGDIQTNLHMTLAGTPSYSGIVNTVNFNVGKLIGNDNIGNLNFSGKIAGKGFDSKALALDIDGKIQSFYFNNYNYQNISAIGKIKNKSFNGTAKIEDPNLNVPALSGSIDFSKRLPELKVNALINKLDFLSLHLTNDALAISGKFELNFTGTHPDNFLGTAKVYDANLSDKGKKLSFDSLVINTFIANNIKHLSVSSNELDLVVDGNFRVLEMPAVFQNYLNKYYPSFVSKNNKPLQPQNFTFDIKTRHVDEYVRLIDKRIYGFDDSHLSGSISTISGQMGVTANVPQFKYKNISFNGISVKATGSDSLVVMSSVSQTTINDSLTFPNTRIDIKALNDASDISIKTSANQALNEADLSVRLMTMTDGFNVIFNPSSFVINNKRWILEKGGSLTLSKNLFTASEVKFNQENQQLVISTIPSITRTTDLNIDLKNINIGDISPFIVKYPRLEGLMTGNIVINTPFNDPVLKYKTQIDQFRLDNDSIGVIKAAGEYVSADKIVTGKVISDNASLKLSSDVKIELDDSSNNQLQIVTSFNNSEIHPLEKYISFLFTNLHGQANGLLSITGTFKQPKIIGDVKLNKTSFIVDYTKAKYFLEENSILSFKNDEIDLTNIVLHDSLKHVASAKGKMYHKFFNDFYFDNVSFVTDHFSNGQPGKFLLLNTTARDNKDFYGHLVGDAHLSLNGPEDDMTMTISGEPTDSSHIYLPTGESAQTGKIDYIDFIKFGKEMKQDYVIKKQSNIKVNIDIDANPYAKIDVILDDVTGDVIKAQGTGKLNITAGTRDPFVIRGRYDILQGLYTFNFQTFFKTPFVLQQGFIEWTGDPYQANMNIDAIYRARQVDLSGIVTSNGYSSSKGDIDILFKLRGTLKDPKPDFEFQFAFNNPLKSDPIANEYLKTKFQADKNTLNKEVTALLLFNSIITDQQNLLSGNNTGNFVTRSLGQVISNTLSSSLNNILKKVLKTDAVNLYTNINTSDFNFQNSQKTFQNVGNFGLSTAFLKNRLQLNLGGNIDYNLQRIANTNSNFLFTPDVSFEYFITPDGKFRVVGFNRIDAGLGDISGITRRNRTGVLLSYHKDFNTFNELFGIKK
ncbi:MAG: translocation/assembly module TamB domain-containing protein [Ginsengibacter sp.]